MTNPLIARLEEAEENKHKKCMTPSGCRKHGCFQDRFGSPPFSDCATLKAIAAAQETA
jgi:hypothetical protein